MMRSSTKSIWNEFFRNTGPIYSTRKDVFCISSLLEFNFISFLASKYVCWSMNVKCIHDLLSSLGVNKSPRLYFLAKNFAALIFLAFCSGKWIDNRYVWKPGTVTTLFSIWITSSWFIVDLIVRWICWATNGELHPAITLKNRKAMMNGIKAMEGLVLLLVQQEDTIDPIRFGVMFFACIKRARSQMFV